MLRRLLVQSARQTARPSVASTRGPLARASFVRAYSEAAKEEKAADAAAETSAEEAKELSPLEKELSEIKSKLEKKDKESAQYKDQLMRSIADFRNLQETTKREITKAKEFALQKFAKDLLESVDNFDRALSVVDADKRTDPENHKELVDLYEGIKMTQNVFEKTLEKHGLKKIFPEGEKFDPNQHEATFEAPQPDKEPGTVFFVQQAGFLLNDRVLRAAKVGVVQGDY